MNEDRTMLIGVDLGTEFTQVCCYEQNSRQAEPESISITSEKKRYRIPTVICRREGTGEWLIGEEARECCRSKETDLVDQMLELASNMQDETIHDKTYSAVLLLEKFFSRLLHLALQQYAGKSIRMITITVKHLTGNLEMVVRNALSKLGLKEDRVQVISRIQSFMYFSVSQNSQLWVNDVVLFDFDKDGLMFYRLSFERKQKPVLIAADKVDLSEEMNQTRLLREDKEKLLQCFRQLSEKVLLQRTTSAVYVTGAGFEHNWADEVLKSWCNGRRVFRGQNLYAKGACYTARLFTEAAQSKYSLLEDETVRSSIGIKIYRNAVFEIYPLLEMGTSWKKADVKFNIILDDTDELQFVIKDFIRQDLINVIIQPEYLPIRENKTMKLSLRLFFLDRETLVLQMRDMGFGEFYPSTYRIWEQIIRM